MTPYRVLEVLMDRHDFLTATAIAAVSPIPKLDALAPLATRQYFELRRYAAAVEMGGSESG